MNRNVIKWMLIAAVIAGAAAYLIIDSGKGGKKEKSEVILEGHSKAFSVQPYDGIAISAEENALDRDREFKVTPLGEKEWERMEKASASNKSVQPLLAFKMDSGQAPNEYYPGVFTCKLDLEKMGIPKNMYNELSIWRYDGEEMIPYTSWIEDGQLVFRSDHNAWWQLSTTTTAAESGTFFGVVGGLIFAYFYLDATWTKWQSTDRLYEYFFFQHHDAATYYVGDKYGNFKINFRFSDTEWKGRRDEFVRYNEEARERFAQLEKQARKLSSLKQKEQQFEKIMNSGVFRLFGSKERCEKTAEDISFLSVLTDLCQKDTTYQRLLKKMVPPPSVYQVGEYLKECNRYLTDYEHLKPQTICLEVDLVNTSVTKEAQYMHPSFKEAYMLVNFDKMWGGNPKREALSPVTDFSKMLINVNHELLHHRQKITTWMDLRTEETTAAYNEYRAARYFYDNGLIKTKVPTEPSPRMNYETFVIPFDSRVTDHESAYTYADFMDSLQVYTGRGKENYLPLLTLFDKYSYLSSHKSNYMKWFGIKDEQVFDNYFRRFSHNSFASIVNRQTSALCKDKNMGALTVVLSPDNPIKEIKTERNTGKLIAQAMEVNAAVESGPNIMLFNAFFVRDKKTSENDLTFCWSRTTETYNSHKDDMYMHSEEGQSHYYATYCKIPKGKFGFKVVGLFRPEEIRIHGVKNDKVSFEIEAPAWDLLYDKYVTGAIITYKDKNGYVRTKDVAPRYFGKKVGWKVAGSGAPGNQFTLTVHWYYKPNDHTVYESPESLPAQWGTNEKPKAQVEEGPEPEKNYWKQTAVRSRRFSTSQDNKETDGQSVSRDFRSVTLVHDANQKSCDFMGMSALEEDGNYVSAMHLDGTVTYTEPPKFWKSTQRYKAVWEIADDPYVLNMAEPYSFEFKNSPSDPAACTQAGKEKRDTGRSAAGRMDWPRSVSTTFEARHPEKDGPKSFTFVQEFSVTERAGSDLKATVTLEYDYEWVGDPAEEEQESSPDTIEENPFNKVRLDAFAPWGKEDLAYREKVLKDRSPGSGTAVILPYERFGTYTFNEEDLVFQRDGDGYRVIGVKHTEEPRFRGMNNYVVDYRAEIKLDKDLNPLSGTFSGKWSATNNNGLSEHSNISGSFTITSSLYNKGHIDSVVLDAVSYDKDGAQLSFHVGNDDLSRIEKPEEAVKIYLSKK